MDMFFNVLLHEEYKYINILNVKFHLWRENGMMNRQNKKMLDRHRKNF